MQPSRATTCTLVAVFGPIAALAAACNSILGNDSAEVVPADAATSLDAGRPDSPMVSDPTDASDAAMGWAASPCPSDMKGPVMVNVANLFCIDSTEVTLGQYSQFLAAGKTPGSLGEP